MLSTTTKTANPGGIHIQGIPDKICSGRARFNIFPHDGAGGGTPRPKKLRPASERIDDATWSVADTNRGEKALGRMWRNITRPGFAPRAVAADTKSVVLSFKNSALRRRAGPGQER